jgi:hypothetical protein
MRGQMKSHMLLLKLILEDSGIRCCTSTTRDFNTITRRVEAEGMSFLTISLPAFCDDLQKGLADGLVESATFVGYSKVGRLPRFLSGFTTQIFNTYTGLLLDEPSIEAIHSLRQITLLFGKVNLPCSDTRVKAAFDKFIECEKQVRLYDKVRTDSDLSEFRRISSILFGDVFSILDRKIYDGDIVPKHGPGKTADHLDGNAKYEQTVWTERLETYFPHMENLFPSVSHFLNGPEIHLLDPGSEVPVKVTAVPKTLKTPRIIAIEPTCMQYMQQGLMEVIVERIESSDSLSHFIGFSDQKPNQQMARDGSLSGGLATLDLSEASDRVSNQLVRELGCYWPHLRDAVEATRSRKADVPGYGVQRLAKFASMGSALCFPMEAMVFLTIIFQGICEELNKPFTRELLSEFEGMVRVYGDDIIVPVEYVHSVVSKLEAFGLIVNKNKSFWTGKFRESCGKEFYDGSDVSIVRCRRTLPSQRRDVLEMVSMCSLRNQLYFAGYWRACAYLDSLARGFIPWPIVEETSPGLGRHSFLPSRGEKDCPDLQRPLVKAAVVSGQSPPSKLEGSGALLKYFLKRGEQPFADGNHLERSGRPQAVYIKLRWVPTC